MHSVSGRHSTVMLLSNEVYHVHKVGLAVRLFPKADSAMASNKQPYLKGRKSKVTPAFAQGTTFREQVKRLN
jgi:hypothetical protein